MHLIKSIIDHEGFVLEPNSDITEEWRLSRFCKASNSVYREVLIYVFVVELWNQILIDLIWEMRSLIDKYLVLWSYQIASILLVDSTT